MRVNSICFHLEVRKKPRIILNTPSYLEHCLFSFTVTICASVDLCIFEKVLGFLKKSFVLILNLFEIYQKHFII